MAEKYLYERKTNSIGWITWTNGASVRGRRGQTVGEND